MTSQEKAKQLFEKFLSEIPWSDYDYPEVTAKKCALIAVEEICAIMKEEYLPGAEKIDNWQQVKEAIEKL